MRQSDYRLSSATALCCSAGRVVPSRLRSLPVLVALSVGIHAASVSAAPPLPDNGKFVAGSGTITRNGANLDITQSGDRGVINWNGFSIGAGRTVSINNGSGATLNRVTGSEMSTIDGKLTATGSVYLINPQGVLVGRSGVITTGGRFVASTLDTDNDSFMEGSYYLTLAGNSNASVVNLGKISSTGGDVFLVSRNRVVNVGTVEAPNGTAEFAAGSEVYLTDSAYGQQVSVAAPSNGRVVNVGTVHAALISLQAADGNIYTLAGRHGELRATGTETRDGHVYLVAQGGAIDAHGATIAARNADGSGGAVDMTADTIKVSGAKVSTAQWNLNAPQFTIDQPTAATLASNLSGGTSIAVNASGGDINVLSDLRWQGASTLALNAYRSVAFARNTTIANSGAGNLLLRADTNAIDNRGSVINLGTFDWSQSTGIVSSLYDMNGSYTPGTIRTNASWSAAPFSGLVTQVTGYQLVNSITDLRAVNGNLGGNYALGNSFDLGGTQNSVPSIGSSAHPFSGQFDGMGHLLSGLNVYTPATGSYTGLFGVIGKTGVVRNFALVESTASSSRAPVGLIAGENDGRIVNMGATGTVTMGAAPGASAGGLVGVNRGTIQRSWSGVVVTGQGDVGGLVGENDGAIVQSYSLGDTSGGTRSQVGGLVGVNRGTIGQSYSSGAVKGTNYHGGLVGNNSGTISQSFTTSTLESTGASPRPSGGIAGSNTGTIARDVYWNTETSGALAGVGTGTAVPRSSGMTIAQMGTPARYGPTWDFSATGVWALPPGYGEPELRWLYGQ